MDDKIASQLADAFAGLVSAGVRSVILHGSLTLDDFVPGRSDIDLLMVVDRPLPAAEAQALVTAVRDADLGPAGGLDLHVVTGDVAASPTRTPQLNLHVGRYPGLFETQSTVDSDPDLLPELSMARAQGRALLGAEPREVLGEIPAGWIRDRGRHWLRFWLTVTDDVEFAGFMALSACRIWRYSVEEVHCSKTEAARWALARDPSLTAVEQALRQRLVDPNTVVSPDGIRILLETVLAEIR